ncbi:S-adenosyl-L-methionine-dependent methyltransferase [Pilobolus umbonatus]|nr:S-adenosyl-L-methionine-dependent methyltransferase [Pilobolus umbonatus]
MVFDISQLPPSFKQFLSDNDIDPVIYTIDDLPRYIRINTHLDTSKQPTLQQLKDQLQTDEVEEVKDMPGFYSVQLTKTTQRISDMKAYKDHAIFGIDLSSALAVTALDINEDDQVLDLCCAPGAKLCMISNLLGKSGLGTVTGVDISSHRLATCRSLIKKYKVGEKVRLFEADGTQFCVPPPSRLGNRVILSTAEHKTKRQKSEYPVPFYASKLLRSDTQSSRGYYDKVLVDAECTHDGSIAHILKVENAHTLCKIQ